jgi:hypothetical protein
VLGILGITVHPRRIVMSNPLVDIGYLLDEVARAFVGRAHSSKYHSPVIYLLKEFESQGSVSALFEVSDYEDSLKIIRDRIDERLENGQWSRKS